MENVKIALRRLKRLGFNSSTLSQVEAGVSSLREHVFQLFDSERNEEGDSRETPSFESLKEAVTELECRIEAYKGLPGWHTPLDWAGRGPTPFWLACDAFELVCDEISERERQILDANDRIKARSRKKMMRLTEKRRNQVWMNDALRAMQCWSRPMRG